MPLETQAAAILAHLRSHPEGLTALDALQLGFGMRLAARIADIRDHMLAPDEVITAEMERHDGGRHARYRLVTTKPGQVGIWDEETAA